MNILNEIDRLKKEKKAIILAHYYQNPEIQDIADYVGDSYYLSQIGQKSDAEVIVYCGVQFMAESAKILSPNKKVLFPAYTNAPCCMEYQATDKAVLKLKEEHPNAKVVTYINSSSKVKAVSDACCTSSSAMEIVKNIDANEIIFVPDRNLASWVAEHSNKKIIPFDGCCNIHDKVRPSHIEELIEKHGTMTILAHPECQKSVRDRADYVGSTSGILNAIKELDRDRYLIVTEKGIAHEIDKLYPNKEFFYLNMFCNPMKKVFLETVYDALNEFKYEIDVDSNIVEGAQKALSNMHKLAE